MHLSDITDSINYNYIFNNKEAEVTEICCNSAKVSAGSLFVCISGTKIDGHSFAKDAEVKKAAAIIAEKEVDVKDIPVIYVDDTRKALAEVSQAFYGNPAKKLKIIGVTGTNGKTSVSYMIKNILEQCGYKVGLIGTVANMIGDVKFDTSLTTPDAPELHKLFAEMVKEGVNYVVMEVSSHSLAQHRVYGMEFAASVITNITQDHLDFHKTIEEYAKAKAMLFENSKICVLNSDDPHFELMKQKATGQVVTYSKSSDEADIYAYDILTNANGVSFNVKTGADYYNLYTEIPGCFTVDNALAAASIASVLKIPSGFVRMAFKKLKGIKGRIERVETGKDFSVFIDYAHTPDGLEKILSTINEFKEGRLITVFGCGGDRDSTKRPIMGKIASELSDVAIVTSDNPRTEAPMKIIEDILKGIETENYIVVPGRKDAIAEAIKIAEKNDIILLAGKGHETYQILNEGKIHFDEREIVKELL